MYTSIVRLYKILAFKKDILKKARNSSKQIEKDWFPSAGRNYIPGHRMNVLRHLSVARNNRNPLWFRFRFQYRLLG